MADNDFTNLSRATNTDLVWSSVPLCGTARQTGRTA
jgi:hypothetical protein